MTEFDSFSLADDTFNEEEQIFRRTVRAFFDRELDGRIKEIEAAGSEGKDFWKRASAAGLVGLPMPQEFGGAGVGPIFTVIISYEMGRSMGFATVGGSIATDLAGSILIEGGPETLIREWAPKIVAGAVQCMALTEPDAGSDVAAIRTTLDQAGCERTVLMSYAAKFVSSLYGPFRVAADSAPKGGATLKDRTSYQLDPARPADAWLSAQRDADEGADILMVKPGLPYLDVLRELSQAIRKPWAVYHTSGEFAALEALAAQGLAPRAALHREIMTAFKRAGASMIITYGAREAREWLRD